MNRKLLFVVNVDWFFLSHRLPIAIEAIKQGYDVHLACGVTSRSDEIQSHGIKVHALPLSRSGTSLVNELKSVLAIWRVIKQVKPDVVHLVTIKPAIYGGLVSRLAGVKQRVVSISGLGYVFLNQGIKASAVRSVISLLYKLALRRKNTAVIFQNPSDRDLFLDLKIIELPQAVLIRGSGVELSHYPVQPEPDGAPVVMLLARLLKDKGVIEFVEAAKILKQKNLNVRMVLVGDTDENPQSVSATQLQSWASENLIEHWGYSHQVATTIANSNLMVLPSYREGLPKSLIEAAACGRAVITTDVPGCRDAIIPDVTGVLVPVKNSQALATAIETLLLNSELRSNMAKAGRQLAEEEFTIQNVVAIHMDLYCGAARKA